MGEARRAAFAANAAHVDLLIRPSSQLSLLDRPQRWLMSQLTTWGLRPTRSGPSKLVSLRTKPREPGVVNVTGKEHRSPLKFVNSCSTTSDSETTSAGTSSRTDESLTHHPQLPRIGSDFCMVFS